MPRAARQLEAERRLAERFGWDAVRPKPKVPQPEAKAGGGTKGPADQPTKAPGFSKEKAQKLSALEQRLKEIEEQEKKAAGQRPAPGPDPGLFIPMS